MLYSSFVDSKRPAALSLLKPLVSSNQWKAPVIKVEYEREKR